MGYGFNDNTYKVLQPLQYYDVFNQQKCQMQKDDEMGSAAANAIIVTEEQQPDVWGLEGEPYIAKMIEFGYIEQITA